MSFWVSKAVAASTLMPVEGTAIARDVDRLYIFLLIISLFGFIALIGAMTVFIIKYRRTPNGKSAYITHNKLAEFLWSFIPLCVFLFVFAWGWVVYHKMRTFPEDSMEVHVLARQWSWEFQYKSGKKSPDLYVPVGRDVKLIMTSQDVIHSFYIPAFRIKQDVVPGRYTAEWFRAEQPGNYQVFCAEYCGTSHSNMMAKIKAVPIADFENWLGTDPMKGLTMAQYGQKLFSAKGCVACHTVDGTPKIGPTLKGVFGSVVPLEGGNTVNADENYVRESILSPQAKVVRGFTSVLMPTFAGQVDDTELNALIEYVKSLK